MATPSNCGKKEHYSKLCMITADLSHLNLNPRKGRQGKTYFRVDYEIVLLFGLTELKAQIAWKENVRCIVLWFFLWGAALIHSDQ
jgi:hypothetical protein